MAKSSGKTDAAAKPRQLKAPKYASFKLQKRIKPDTAKLPGSFRLLWRAFVTLVRHWKVFLGITVVYGVLSLIFVGLGNAGGLDDVRETLSQELSGGWGAIATGIGSFMYLIGASSAPSAAAGAYQFVLALIVSLALIWTLREVYAEHKVRIRDGFYRGMYPLVPFVLVLAVIGLQLIPFLIGAYLFNMVRANGIAAGQELVVWVGIFFILALISLYMLCSSLFALYIACLPDMTPLRALRSARNLVLGRRWVVIRKIIFLPIALMVLVGAVVVPLIFIATPAAVWGLFVLSLAAIAAAHSYMYALYRSLL